MIALTINDTQSSVTSVDFWDGIAVKGAVAANTFEYRYVPGP